ncbi:MAG: energy transducer TonB [Pseudomonadota bacterium]
MISSVIGAVAALVLAASPAPDWITNPDWAELPTSDQFADAYPERAKRERVEGGATLLCRVLDTGRLTDCRVVSEAPTGYEFGEAALKIAPELRMKPVAIDGKPVSGGQVRIPLKFKMPEPEDEAADVLEGAIQCFGVLGADFDADPTRQRLIPALDFLRAAALNLAPYANADADTVRARLDAARAKPLADEDFRRDCRADVDNLSRAEP